MNADSLKLACPSCLTVNRVPAARLGDEPKCGKCGALLLDAAPVALGVRNFDAFIGTTELPVVVDFWAQWCGPCHAMAPAFAQVAAEMKTQARFAKVDTEAAQDIAARHAIRSIPTLIVFAQGQEKARMSGAMDAASLKRWLAPQI